MGGKGKVVLGKRAVSIEQIEDRGARLASALYERDVGANDCVAILMRNDFGYLEAQLACARIGAYAVPLNWHLTAQEIVYILTDCGAKVLLVHADLLAGVEHQVPTQTRILCTTTPPEIAEAYSIDAGGRDIPPHVESWYNVIEQTPPLKEHAAGMRGSIVYTSGTTGKPKGVKRQPLYGEAASRFNTLNHAWWELRPGISTVMAGPMYHSAPNVYARSAVKAGGNITLMPRFDAEELLRIIDRDRVTHVHLVPTMFIRLLRLPESVRKQYDLSSLEVVVHGAAPCSQEIKRAMIAWWGPIIHEYYGATETGMVSRCDSIEWLRRPGTVGKPWPGRTIRIYDDQGVLLPPGEIGNIYTSLGDVPQFTYHNAEHERAHIDREGLVTNGDMGYLDSDGYLYLADRKKDMVISGGVNIYPAEIEGVLATHPAIADCAIIGAPDPEYGERLVAFIQTLNGSAIDCDDIRRFLRERIAGFKVPREFNFVASLPRDESGKLMKRKLRDKHWQPLQRQI